MTDEKVEETEAAVDKEREAVALVALGKKAQNEAARQALYADMDAIEALLATGDVGKIATNSALRKAFIITRCVKLNIPIHPEAVIFIPSDKTLKVYHTAVCASLVRSTRGWTSKRIEDALVEGLYTVWVRVYDPKNPEHFADNLGAIAMVDGEGVPMKPGDRASNMKKAFTQAERRATFSLAGLAGEDPREDGGLLGYYPDEPPTTELKIIEPKARLVAAPAPGQPAVVQALGEEVPDIPPPVLGEAPKKKRVVRRRDGTVVPQPQQQGVEEAEAPPTMAIPMASGGPSGGLGNAAGAIGVEGLGGLPVSQAPPETAPCSHPGMQRWLASAPPGKTHPCPDCGEVLKAPEVKIEKPAESPESRSCSHPALKSGKPGHVYACPPPPDGCGQDVRIPGERADKPGAVATTPMPVKPRQVKLVKRIVLK